PGLEGINTALGLNVAAPIAKFLSEKTKDFLDNKRDSDFNHVVKGIDAQELVSNLNIRGGIIRLPEIITKLTGFTPEDDVRIVASKGNIRVDRYDILKDDKK
ncbi:MAG: hypothetical protein V1645_00770, partial [archaeon]